MFGSIREQMPLFPGCEEISTYAERKQCADKKMLAFIYDNIKYPAKARENGVEGMAVVSFVVEKDGSLSEFGLPRDPGAGTGAEALRVVKLMNERGLRWQPGEQADRPVRVQFNLPVKFKLEADEPKEKAKPKTAPLPPPPPPPPPPKPVVEEIFKTVERMSLFPGCSHVADYIERKACADGKLLEFVYGNIKYPPEAIAAGVEGKAMISFVVEKDGRVEEAKIVRDPGAGTGAEALRVVKLMNTKGLRFDPQSSSGRVVRVQYNLPVKFKLE